MDISIKDLDRPLRKIIEHIQDAQIHSTNAGLTKEQEARFQDACQLIADIVYEKHTGHARLEVK